MSNVSTLVVDEIHPCIYGMLDELGIPRRLTGYDELAYAIQIASARPSEKLSITKIIYPSVAERFGVTAGSVERCMRTCISKVFEMTPHHIIERYFGVYPSEGGATNSYFIYTLAYEAYKLINYSMRKRMF